MVALLVVQVCCVAFAAIAAGAAWKTLRDGFHLTDTLKVQGATARVVGAGVWLMVGVGFLVVGFVAVPMRMP
jgi:hypothetical protein